MVHAGESLGTIWRLTLLLLLGSYYILILYSGLMGLLPDDAPPPLLPPLPFILVDNAKPPSTKSKPTEIPSTVYRVGVSAYFSMYCPALRIIKL